jgi:hypothetical protein
MRDDDEGIIDPREIAREFHEEESKLRKRIHSIFPMAKRWANVATILSIPLAITGLAMDGSLLTLAGAASVGLAQAGRQYMEYLESKYRWVGFLQSMPDSHRKTSVEVD